MSSAAEKIKVMQAFEDGAEIEVSHKGVRDWNANINPAWNWDIYIYRVAEKPPRDIWVNMDGNIGNDYMHMSVGLNENVTRDSTYTWKFPCVHYRRVE